MMGWRKDEMVVNIIFNSSQIMHVEVNPSFGTPLYCSFVYGATHKQERLEMLCWTS